jgi:hypothetical protein
MSVAYVTFHVICDWTDSSNVCPERLYGTWEMIDGRKKCRIVQMGETAEEDKTIYLD